MSARDQDSFINEIMGATDTGAASPETHETHEIIETQESTEITGVPESHESTETPVMFLDATPESMESPMSGISTVSVVSEHDFVIEAGPSSEGVSDSGVVDADPADTEGSGDDEADLRDLENQFVDATARKISADYDSAGEVGTRRSDAAEAARNRLFEAHDIAVSRDDPIYSEAVFLGAAVDVLMSDVERRLASTFDAADRMLHRAETAAATATELAAKAVYNVSSEAASDAWNQLSDATGVLQNARNDLVTTANAITKALRDQVATAEAYINNRRQEHVDGIANDSAEALKRYLVSLDQISSAAALESLKRALEQKISKDASESFGHRAADAMQHFYVGIVGEQYARKASIATTVMFLGLVAAIIVHWI